MTNADVFQLVAAHLHTHPALLLLASACSSARQGVQFYLANHIPIPGVSPERAWHLLVRGRLTPRSSLAETLWVLERCRTAYDAPSTAMQLPQPSQVLAQWGSQLARPLAAQLHYCLPALRMAKEGVLGQWAAVVEISNNEVAQFAGYMSCLLHTRPQHDIQQLVERCVCRSTSLPWAMLLVMLHRPDLLEAYLATVHMTCGFYAASLYKAVFEAESPVMLDVLLRQLPVSPRNISNIMRKLEPRIELEGADTAMVLALGSRGWRVPLTPYSETIYRFYRREGGRCTLHGPLSAVLGFAGRLPQPQN